jgi:DNA modification methylase
MKQDILALDKHKAGPVVCLGKTFPSDQARREHYLKLLAEKLKDADFHKIEGFPVGEDKDILALSDPPYYTACPNPWIGDFITHYGRPYDPKEKYHREPFAADVSEGKNHPIYNAHSYHTKVPHRAIMRYILHYTEPGDIVFDGFCGTGMTGVAAQLCGDRTEIAQLGYKVDSSGKIHDETGSAVTRVGARTALLNDLSPFATQVAANLNTPAELHEFQKEANRILNAVEAKLGWTYFTLINASPTQIAEACKLLQEAKSLTELMNLVNEGALLQLTSKGRDKSKPDFSTVVYFVWSDVLVCPDCGAMVNYWKATVDVKNSTVKDPIPCTECGSEFTKRSSSVFRENKYDSLLQAPVQEGKQEIVFRSHRGPGSRKHEETTSFDKVFAQKLEEFVECSHFPVFELTDGYNTRQPRLSHGFSYAHQFFSPRNRAILSALWGEIIQSEASARVKQHLVGWFFSSQSRLHKLNRYTPQHGRHVGPLKNTLYISSSPAEISPFYFAKQKLLEGLVQTVSERSGCIQTMDAGLCLALPNSVDYIFVDPPFGANIMYSELNSLLEAWLGVRTSIGKEAIQNEVQGKGIDEYRALMLECFKANFRVLKPGRWMTVEFSNSSASVWNAIQSALQQAGFVVASVAALDKGRGGLFGIIGPVAVKQDLVISAYKPNGGLEERFKKTGHTVDGVWDFVRTHLRNLPVIKAKGGELDFITERDPRIVYDRMVAFYVGHGVPVPLSSAEFQAALADKFPEREGMFFLPEQVAEWDKKRAKMQGVGQMSIFVEDEKSAIDWLRSFLKARPSTYQDTQPEFMQQLGASWKKFETRPELSLLLEQNFLKYDGKADVPSQIHSYLSTQFKELRNLPKDDARLKVRAKDRWFVPDPAKAVDVESVRNKRLLQEFWELCSEAGVARVSGASAQQALPLATQAAPKKASRKKLKEVRTEAVRLGFKECFAAKDYATILGIAAHLPENVIEEDEQLQMMHDMAEMRVRG